MSDSRPKIIASAGTNVKIQVPAGWFTTISAVSRKSYNQLVTVDYEDATGDAQTAFIGNTWGKLNEVMRNIDDTSDLLAIIPQEDPHTMELNVYYSTQGTIRGEDLKNDKYKSTRLNIITTNKPIRAPKDFPDYTTYLIFVEDAPATQQVAGTPEFDDSLITVNVIKGVAKTAEPPLDIGTQALAETGKQAIEEFINQYTDPTLPGPTVPPQPSTPDKKKDVPPEIKALPVGILGAGVAGLYIAMMLDSLGIKYEIMEGSGRTGGRLYTHNFPKNGGKYQYYDVGAMRYPDTSFMKRTFDLARNRLGLTNKMIHYIRKNGNAFLCYNNISVKQSTVKPGEDTFKFSVTNDGHVPDEWVAKGSGYFWTNILGDLRKLFVDHPFPEAFEMLKQYDGHSVASYLTLVKGVPYEVMKWYETMESRTGLNDSALTETVLASLVFNDPRSEGQEIDWFCFDGGSEIVHKAMEALIKYKPIHYQRAVAARETDNGLSITVTFDQSGNPRPQTVSRFEKKYSNVISTMTFSCLRMVDLDNVYMSNGQRGAIRQLTYTPSIKVGLQFKSAWWEKLGIVGGQSSTDRPIRDCVYPSYGPDESHPNNTKSNCMIASYNGMQDAQRLGGLMNGRGTPEEKVLLDLIIRDLAVVHQKDVSEIWNEYEDYFPWDFYRDQFQLGAFCQFGPGQFKYTYPFVTQPASKDQRFHFAGEGTSTFHGWVAGALNSAWRVVLGMLLAHPELNPNPDEDIIEKFKGIWGPSEEWDPKQLAKHVYVASELTKLNLGSRAPNVH